MGKIIETFLDLKNMSFKIEIDTFISSRKPMSEHMTIKFQNTSYKNRTYKPLGRDVGTYKGVGMEMALGMTTSQ